MTAAPGQLLREQIESFRKTLAPARAEEPLPRVVRQQQPQSAHEPTPFEMAVRNELWDIGSMLIAKNAAYGNSALDPMRVFSRASPVEQLLVRIDDKLSRVRSGVRIQDQDDVTLDLIGYIVLLRLAQKHQGL